MAKLTGGSKMKRFIALMILIMLPLILLCEKRANVISKAGHWLTIDKGKKDGIEVGFTGIVKTIVKNKPLNIGFFKVEKVLEDKSELNITEMGKGFNAEQSEFVVFQNIFVQPPPAPVTQTNQTQKTANNIPVNQPIEWYLEQGNLNFQDKKFKEAKDYYNKIIEINPRDPVAQRKIKECEDNDTYYSYMKSGEACALNQDYYSALEYYLEAWKAISANSNEVLGKMLNTSQSDIPEWERFKETKISQLDECFNNSEKFTEKSDIRTRLSFYIIGNKLFPDKRKVNSDKMIELFYSYKGNWEMIANDFRKEFESYFDYSIKALKDSEFEMAIDYLFYAYRLLPMEKEEIAKRLIVIMDSQKKEWDKYSVKYQSQLAEYISNALDYYNSGDIDTAMRFFLYGFRFFPERAREISISLINIASKYNEKWQKFANENSMILKNYIDQGDSLLTKNEFEKALDFFLIAYRLIPFEEKNISERFKKINEFDQTLWRKFEIDNFELLKPLLINQFYPFFAKIKDKSQKISRNNQGYWEAILSNGIEVVYIPEGNFTIGADIANSDSNPKHSVFLDGFWIGKYEVSFEQYDLFCTETKREKPDDKGWGRGRLPVINISWFDASEFSRWLSQNTGLTFRLPTEAEWEKAARGTDEIVFPWGNTTTGEDKLNFNKSSKLKKTVPIGSFPAGVSPYGLFDMAGNVAEWVNDWYYETYYSKSPGKNPQGPPAGSKRVVRGGGWNSDGYDCTTYARDSRSPKSKSKDVGFRIYLDIK